MTTTAGTTLPTAPDLLIEAADTIGNRSAERDNGDGERSMNRAVQMFNAWRGQRGHSPMCEAEGKHRRDDWVDGSAYMALACECIERELALPF